MFLGLRTYETAGRLVCRRLIVSTFGVAANDEVQRMSGSAFCFLPRHVCSSSRKHWLTCLGWFSLKFPACSFEEGDQPRPEPSRVAVWIRGLQHLPHAQLQRCPGHSHAPLRCRCCDCQHSRGGRVRGDVAQSRLARKQAGLFAVRGGGVAARCLLATCCIFVGRETRKDCIWIVLSWIMMRQLLCYWPRTGRTTLPGCS
jgi:hypothetical protein